MSKTTTQLEKKTMSSFMESSFKEVNERRRLCIWKGSFLIDSWCSGGTCLGGQCDEETKLPDI